VKGIPIGLGEPFFGSVESEISRAVFSIPAIKGIEFGAGFSVAKMTGSTCNDNIIDADGHTATNNNGGINGGITNGNDIIFRVAVKPTPSISLPQDTYNIKDGKVEPLTIVGRHDLCIALRVPVVLEAATAIALADLSLIAQKSPRIFLNELD
jgi:chorismate synthase